MDRVQILIIGAFICLYTATININKYVLTVLSFTYPTLFQGWQTLVGAILIRLLSEVGLVELEFWPPGADRWWWLQLVPSMLLYAGSIYSGSVALSKLPVCIFLAMQNSTCIVTETADALFRKKLPAVWRCLVLLLLFASVISCSYLWTKDNPSVFMWLVIHISATSLYDVYQKVHIPSVHISDLQRSFLNYLFSVAVFIPGTYLLGDVTRARDFQFWYHYKFYVGCGLSGVLGCFLSMDYIQLKERTVNGEHSRTEIVMSAAKITAALVSVLVYSLELRADITFWFLLNFCCCLMLAAYKESTVVPPAERVTPFVT